MHTADPKELMLNPFTKIGREWMLSTAGDETAHNTMTASWGGLGVIWNKNVATCYVRPQRYTFGCVEESGYFTLSFLPEEKREVLNLCGSKSGRDTDKFAACGMTALRAACGAVYPDAARLVLVCRKLYAQDLREEHFVDRSIVPAVYAAGDFHRMYVGEIVEVLERDE